MAEGKKLIFLIHGIGDHPPDTWSQSYESQIKRLWSEYSSLNSVFPFDQLFKIVPIGYDDIFEDLRTRWKENHEEVNALMGSGGFSGAGVPGPVLRYITKILEAGKEDDFLRTHILDLLLYYFTDLIREPVTLRVASTILNHLSENPTAMNEDWSVIAHSMGTSVTHDALHALYHGGVPAPEGNGRLELTTGHTRMRSIIMVANCARLLERRDRHGRQNGFQAYNSGVRPSRVDGNGICSLYIDCRHNFDPVPMPRPYPVRNDWPGPEPEDQELITRIRLVGVADLNVHALEHYLEDPDFHIPLFRSLTMDSIISEEDHKEARRMYKRRLLQSHLSTVQARLEKADLKADATWLQIVKSLLIILGGADDEEA